MNKIKIFDLGSNTFRQTRNLIERFRTEGEVVEVHTFEAQKELALENLDKLRIDYPSIDFTHNNVAVWNEDTNLNFYECKKWGGNYKGGSSLIRHSGSNPNSIYEYDDAITTPAIDFVNYFKIHADESTYNFIKMDIEGTEYIVLPDLIQSSCINNLNELACEFHAEMYRDSILKTKFASLDKKIKQSLMDNNIKLSNWF
jgi:FkbM family methyltransferase